eukprot:737952-Prymnesium_polylepis.1
MYVRDKAVADYVECGNTFSRVTDGTWDNGREHARIRLVEVKSSFTLVPVGAVRFVGNGLWRFSPRPIRPRFSKRNTKAVLLSFRADRC